MRSRYWSRAFAVLALLAALVAGLPVGLAGAADAVVSAPCAEAEFDAALDQVQSTGGGTITFDCGGSATIEFSDEKTITSNVRIDGGEEITLSGDDSTRLFWVNEGATLDLDSLEIVDGGAEFGGAIYNDGGTVTITNSLFGGNDAEFGGAITNDGGTVSISESEFVENSAEVGGAIYNAENSTLTITDSDFEFNDADEDGGAIHNESELTVQDSDFEENEAYDGYGGAINDDGGSTITITDTEFDNNYAYEDGGAIDSEADSLTITGSYFYENYAESGDGGAVWTDSETTISESYFDNNESDDNDGGAVYSSSDALTIDRTTFYENEADQSGGGVYVERGTVTILRSMFDANESDFDVGGGLFVEGFEEGEGDATVVSIDRSTFSHNYTGSDGGAIFVYEATVHIANSTIYDNEAEDYGGGIYVDSDGGTVTLFNTIVADNDFDDCDGNITSSGYNLDSDESCNLDQPTDLPDTDPELSDHDDYGGQTETHLPLEGSPVIDAGPATCTSPDQRGQLAPLGDACDIGAVELGIASGPASSDGKLCVNRSTGQVSFPNADGNCAGRMLYPVDFTEAEQTTLCIDRATGQVTLGQPGCSRRAEAHELPDDFSLLTCTNRVTGVVRGVQSLDQCTRYDTPGAIIVEYEPVIYD